MQQTAVALHLMRFGGAGMRMRPHYPCATGFLADGGACTMVVVLVVVSSVVLLVLVALYEQHRRRSVLEATIPVGTTRSARRKILRAHRVRVRSTAVRGPAPSLRRLWRWLVIAPLNSRPVRTGRAEWRSRRACFSPKNGDPPGPAHAPAGRAREWGCGEQRHGDFLGAVQCCNHLPLLGRRYVIQQLRSRAEPTARHTTR